MRVLRVQLTNIKSYVEQVIELAPGTNSICGQNGAGKTTIVEAIGWALFDALPYNQKQFKRDGTTWGQVAVLFSARDGREYQVVRRAGSGATWYVFDPEISDKLAEGAADVKGWLSRHLGAEDSAGLSVLFDNAVGVPQGSLTMPFLQTREKRKDTFDPILRVDEYSKASDELRQTRTYLQQRVAASQAAAEKAAVEADKIPFIQASIRDIGSGIAVGERQLTRLRIEQEQQAVIVGALETEERRIADLRSHLQRLRQALEATQTRLSRARTYTAQALEAYNVVEATRQGHGMYEAAVARLQQLEPLHAKYVRLSSKLEEERRNVERLTQELESNERKAEAAEAEANRLPELEARHAELQEIERELHALQTFAQKLPTYVAEISATEEQIRSAKEERDRLERERAHIESLSPVAIQLAEFRQRHDALLGTLQAASDAKKRAAERQQSAAAIERQVAEATRNVERYTKMATVPEQIQQLAGSLELLEKEERDAGERVVVLRSEYKVVEAQKKAGTVGCPLDRSDCLAIQKKQSQDGWYDRELLRIREEGQRAKQHQEALRTRLDEAKSARDALLEAESSKSRLDAARHVLQNLQAQYEQTRAEARAEAERAATLDALKQERAELVSQLREAEQASNAVGTLPMLHSAIIAQQATLDQYMARSRTLEEELAVARRSEQEAATMRKRLAPLEDIPRQLRRATALSDALPDLKAAIERDMQDIERTDERVQGLVSEVAQLEDVEEQKAAVETARAENHQAFRLFLENQAAASQLGQRREEEATAEAELISQQTEVREQQASLEAVTSRWDEHALLAARERQSDLAGEIGGLSATIREQKARLADLQAQLQTCEEQARLREEALREKHRLEGLEELLHFARETIKQAQAPITEALLYSVSAEARQLFSEIIDDHSARLSWSSDYEILLERGSERLSFSQLSGGEQMTAALAVRLALLKKLSDVDMAFLDEPTQNMDEARRTNLAQQVAGVKGFEQLFVISHDDTFERQVNHAVVVRKKDGESIVSYGHQEGA